MKYCLAIFILIINFTHAYCQVKDSATLQLFNRAVEFYRNDNKDSAVNIWEKIVSEKSGKESDIYGNSFFNIPTTYWALGKNDKAKEWYLKIIGSELKDDDETGSIMEPHTNYKHKSAAALAGLYMQDSNYAEALSWLYKADTVYRYWGFEGSATSISKREAYLLSWKTDLLNKLNKESEAIREIITALIYSQRLESFFSQSEEDLLKIIEGKEKEFKDALDKSLESLIVQKKDAINYVAHFRFQGIPYKIDLSSEYPDNDIPHYWKILIVNKNQKVDKKYIISEIKDRSFYKRLAELSK